MSMNIKIYIRFAYALIKKYLVELKPYYKTICNQHKVMQIINIMKLFKKIVTKEKQFNDQNFEYFNTITTPKRFGYMWECPDLFELDDYLFLVVCPQRVKQSHFNYENIYPLWTRSYDYKSI